MASRSGIRLGSCSFMSGLYTMINGKMCKIDARGDSIVVDGVTVYSGICQNLGIGPDGIFVGGKLVYDGKTVLGQKSSEGGKSDEIPSDYKVVEYGGKSYLLPIGEFKIELHECHFESSSPIELPQCESVLLVGNLNNNLNCNNANKVKVMCDVGGSISTMSGDVKVAGNTGSVATGSGDIDVKGDILGSVSTMSGDVKTNTISGDVSTMSGDISKSLKRQRS